MLIMARQLESKLEAERLILNDTWKKDGKHAEWHEDQKEHRTQKLDGCTRVAPP